MNCGQCLRLGGGRSTLLGRSGPGLGVGVFGASRPGRWAVVITMPETEQAHLSEEQYARVVARLREAVANMSKNQFIIGDGALEVVPIRPHGGRSPADDLFGVSAWLQRLSEDTSVPYNTLKDYRWVASRWPEQHRNPDATFFTHQLLAAIRDEEERFQAIRTPPLDERTGTRR